MNTRSRILFWGSLFLLISGTIVCWQLRFVEAGTSYWRNQELDKLLTWKTSKNTFPPQMIVTEDGHPALQFPPSSGRHINASKSWRADGSEFIKVRLRNRSPQAIVPYPDGKLSPLSVTITGINENNHPIMDQVGHIVVGEASESWQVSEAIVPLSDQARRFGFGVLTRGIEGDFQISDLDIVQVKQAAWFPVAAFILWLLWGIWLFIAVSQHQSRKLVSLFTSLWLLGWGGYLIFPRTIEIPRPFFSQFWMPEREEPAPPAVDNKGTTAVQKGKAPKSETPAKPAPIAEKNSAPPQPQPAPQTKPAPPTPAPLVKTGPPPEVNYTATHKARKWFKSFGGGRFLMHLGIMGVFAGGLLLFLPIRNAWPYIVTMIIGIELLPAILISHIDLKDFFDVLAYLIAVIIAIPTANKIRKHMPKFFRRFVDP